MEYKNSQKLVSGDTFLIKKKCKRNSISWSCIDFFLILYLLVLKVTIFLT
jgi:hypothetical protein